MATERSKQSRPNTSGGAASPSSRSRTLRFVGLFALIIVASNVAYYQWVVESRFFEFHLASSAALAGKWLKLFGIEAGYRDGAMTGPFLMSIRAGCDGLQAFAVLLAATVAFPARVGARVVGVSIGAVVVFLLNTARLASLYWLGVRGSSWFQLAHVQLWPAALILAMVGLWIVWAAFVGRPREAQRA